MTIGLFKWYFASKLAIISGGRVLFPLKGLPGIMCNKRNVIEATKNVVKKIFAIPKIKDFI